MFLRNIKMKICAGGGGEGVATPTSKAQEVAETLGRKKLGSVENSVF